MRAESGSSRLLREHTGGENTGSLKGDVQHCTSRALERVEVELRTVTRLCARTNQLRMRPVGDASNQFTLHKT